jgi:hypothetical protein
VVHPDSIFPHIDKLKALILPAVADDTYRTLDYGYDMNAFHLGFSGTVDNHTPYGIKPFLALRSATSILQLQSILKVEEIKNEEVDFYPNPASSFILLKHDSEELSVFDFLGKKVLSIKSPYKENLVDINFLIPGIYLLKQKNRGVWKQSRFVKN